MEDFDLIEQMRAGSVDAFTELVKRYQHRIRGYVAGLVGDRAEVVDDIAQETFLAAYRSRDTYDVTRVPIGAWMAGIARHRALTFLRDERRRRRREQDNLSEVLAVGRLEHIEAVEDSDDSLLKLGGCLEALPAQARSLIQARYRNDSSIAVMAEKSGRAETAVRMALSRVRALLRRCIEQHGTTA
jgi:RNA polymerase sigma-70 factor (ECF subfamily)